MTEPELTPSVAPVVTPSEEPKEIPAEETPKEETPAAEPQLYELPDGRKVNAETLTKEWKDNFLPEFTKKSQTLAEIERAKASETNVPEWKKEGYTPKSYAEIIEIAEKQALEKIQSQAAEKTRADAEVAAHIDSQLKAIKAKDPKLNEDALFNHATKYGFRDLTLAYENMSEMRKVAVVTEERVLKGAAKKVDPIATGGASGPGSAPRYPNATSATEFLARLKK